MTKTKGIWILTLSFNDYEQHGEYYVRAWVCKPNKEDLIKEGVSESEIDHVLAGGGRIHNDYSWYDLSEQS